MIQGLDDRFSSVHQDVALASKIVPSVLLRTPRCIEAQLKSLISAFPGMPSVRGFPSEYERWCTRWQKDKDNGSTLCGFADTLGAADGDISPNTRVLLQVSATRPSSTASNERSFSALKRLKTYLRATMLKERLTGLALLHIHQEIIVPIDEIIDRFANLGPHRLAYL